MKDSSNECMVSYKVLKLLKEEGDSVYLWQYDKESFFRKNQVERKAKFKKIGEDVFSFFQDKAIAEGFEDREGQWEMSCEIVDGIRDKKHVLVEAGVGIGKSFAYIVPVLYYNKVYGKPVVIATSTIALQEQLIHDIDKIMDMLNYDVEVLIAKGQNHFLCKKRFDEYFTPKFIQEKEEHQIIYEAVSRFGYEKADWSIPIPDGIWNRVNVKEYNPQFCKDKCSYCSSCHYHNLRRKMIYTDGIIVCNQDLLTVNMNKKANYRKQLMSEDVGIIVIDEVHNLESKVRSSVTSCISLNQLKDSMYEAGKAVNSFDISFTKKMEQADALIDDVFKSLLKQMDEQDRKAAQMGQDIDRYYVRNIDTNFVRLKKLLDEIQFEAAMSFGDFIGDRNRKNFDEEIEMLEDNVAFLASAIKRNNSEDIFWLERDNGSRGIMGVRLYKCPKEVDKITRNIMFSDSDLPVILTSATITSGKNEDYIKSYAYFINNTGLPIDNSLICEPKISPFNYDEHAMIYYTEHLPHPTKERGKFIEEGVKEITKLLQISNGKALILFTAKTDMYEVYNKLKQENLPFEIIMQKGNSKQSETLEKFRNDTNSVLLGTGSYWEGINIEGVSLSHVIIFKLPFPIREPIIDYKYEQSKGDGLMKVSVPEMVIKLKQGIGRLIRSEQDRGIVSIVDSRVGDQSKAPYRKIIWESLPIKNRTSSIEEITKFYNEVVEVNL